LDGTITWHELKVIAEDVTDANGGVPINCKTTKTEKLAGYGDILKGWRSMIGGSIEKGDSRGANYVNPPHCAHGRRSSGDCEDTTCDPIHECPQFEPYGDTDGGMYVTRVSPEVWQASCNLNSGTKSGWKCDLRIPAALREPGQGIPAPLPRFKIAGEFWVCPAPWTTDTTAGLLRPQHNPVQQAPRKKRQSGRHRYMRFEEADESLKPALRGQDASTKRLRRRS
jgi:hypothetical protein